jgi:hypothetical protein
MHSDENATFTSSSIKWRFPGFWRNNCSRLSNQVFVLMYVGAELSGNVGGDYEDQ